MGCCFVVLRGNGMGLRGGLLRFGSHGWRSWMGPLRRGWWFVIASGLLVCGYAVTSAGHTLFVCCNDGTLCSEKIEVCDDELDRLRLVRLSALPPKFGNRNLF